MTPVEVVQGDGPVILGLPHTGTHVPQDIRARLNANGCLLSDTDWHVDDLYAGLLEGATTVRATFNRYVIDANRPPSQQSLYPGQNTTGLVPLTDFDGRPIWQDGFEPGAEDIAARLRAFHGPYHAALEAEMARVEARHGVVILYDCHSIRGQVPFLFAGRLPDLNIGTNNGRTCAAGVEALVHARCADHPGYSTVLNGRFRGGWTTRHYGHPEQGRHALQMEIAQSAYMTERPPWTWQADRAARLRDLLATILNDLAALAPTLRGTR